MGVFTADQEPGWEKFGGGLRCAAASGGDVRSKSQDEDETLWAWPDLARYPLRSVRRTDPLHSVLSATIAAAAAA